MGHYELVSVKKIDPVVQGFITKCQNLLLTLGRYESRAIEYRNTAQKGVADCEEVVTVDTEDLSGIYYEDKYIPYQSDLFTKTDDVTEGLDSMLTTLRERIEQLEALIQEKQKSLYIESEEYVWVDDFSD